LAPPILPPRGATKLITDITQDDVLHYVHMAAQAAHRPGARTATDLTGNRQ
jgi:hypothetical protein